ncbi:MAG: hypothetical protein KatS3mg001_614 [Candidatus Pacearchaeota archaeon]|nr:MAG: hypothetical protein KatS3mg001_614 [Candidatus Pacearchaeota archaeon]
MIFDIFYNIFYNIEKFYDVVISSVPPLFKDYLLIFGIALVIVIYSVFVWKFYRFLGTKNLLELNLSQYNKYKHQTAYKIFSIFLYFLEYIIILPFLVFLWFLVFSIFLIFMIENLTLKTLLTISIAIITAIRIMAYIPKYGESVAKEVAKLLPLTLLVIAISNPAIISFERIFVQFKEIANFYTTILSYLLFIIVIEVILRFFDLVFDIIGIKEK